MFSNILCSDPTSQNDQYFVNSIGRALNKYSQHHEKVLITVDFNAEDSELSLSQFFLYHAHNIVNEKKLF